MKRQAASKLITFGSGVALGAVVVLVGLVVSGATQPKVQYYPVYVNQETHFDPCPTIGPDKTLEPRVAALEKRTRAVEHKANVTRDALMELVRGLMKVPEPNHQELKLWDFPTSSKPSAIWECDGGWPTVYCGPKEVR